MRMIEHAAKEEMHKAVVDAPAEAARENFFAVVREVFDAFEKTVRDEKFRIAFFRRHARENFRHDEADIVIHAHLRPDVTGGGDEAVVIGEDERHERVVQIHDGRQRVERAFGQRAFGTRAGGGRRFAGHAADEFHEQLRQLHVVNRVVARERADAFLGGIVAAAGQHGADGREHGCARWQAATQPRTDFGDVSFVGLHHIGPLLEVARIFCRLAIYHARVRRGDEVTRRTSRGEIADGLLHRRRELVEMDRVLHQIFRLLMRERLVVGKEIVGAGEIHFRLLVVAAMDRVVGTLEQALFTVLHELEHGIFVGHRQIIDAGRRRDG